MRTFSTGKVQNCIMSRLTSASGRSISRIFVLAKSALKQEKSPLSTKLQAEKHGFRNMLLFYSKPRSHGEFSILRSLQCH